MSHVIKRSNVIDFEAARVRRHAITIAKREATKNFLSPEETVEALAWASYIATWVTFVEVERMVTEFCAGVFAPPKGWRAHDWVTRTTRTRAGARAPKPLPKS